MYENDVEYVAAVVLTVCQSHASSWTSSAAFCLLVIIPLPVKFAGVAAAVTG